MVIHKEVGHTYQYGLQRLLSPDQTHDSLEEEVEDIWNLEKPQKKTFTKQCFITNLLLAALMIGRTVNALSSQFSAATTNIVVLNAMRCLLQTLTGLGIASAKRESLQLPRKNILYVMLIAFLGFLDDVTLVLAASFMPVGDLEAVYRMLCILSTTTIDFCKQHVRIPTIILAIVAILGIIFVIQPWSTVTDKVQVSAIPCEYWDQTPVTNKSSYILQKLHQNILAETTDVTNTTMDGYFITVGGFQYSLKFSPVYLGYILAIISCACFTMYGYVTQHVTFQACRGAINFWMGFIEGIYILITLLVLWMIFGASIFTYPQNFCCVVFTQSFVFSLAISNVIFVYVIEYFHISTIHLTGVLVMVMLYVCQRTILKEFHPGNANALEIVGILLIICGQILKWMQEIWTNKK